MPRSPDANPFLDVETAYKAQALFVEHRLQAGERVVGAKLGLTSRVKRAGARYPEPVYGRLTSGMILPFGEPLPLDELIRPRAEPEIAFLVGQRMEAPVTAPGCWPRPTRSSPPSRSSTPATREPFRLPDSVADNAGAARVVARRPRPRRPATGRSRRAGLRLPLRGGVDTAAGGAAMGDPAAAVVWLVNALAARGEHRAAGTIVLSGGLTTSVALQARRERDRRVRRPRLGRGALRMSEELMRWRPQVTSPCRGDGEACP